MSEAETYDTRVQAIRAYNRPLLEDFGTWLDHKGFSEQTVMNHLGNIYLFASAPSKKSETSFWHRWLSKLRSHLVSDGMPTLLGAAAWRDGIL